MGVLSNKIERDQLKDGDHIYSWRTAYLYAHHGIYVGDGMVIHFTRAAGQETGTGTFLDRVIFSSAPANLGSPCERCGDQSELHGVITSCLDCFLSGGSLYLYLYSVPLSFFLAKARGGTCTLAPSDAPDRVIHRAKYLLEKGFGMYNIFRNNCEDFAIYCKTELLVETSYGVGRSGQLSSITAAVGAMLSAPIRFMAAGGITVIGTGIYVYCVDRYASDIGVRRDVRKIPVERLVADDLGINVQEEAVANMATVTN